MQAQLDSLPRAVSLPLPTSFLVAHACIAAGVVVTMAGDRGGLSNSYLTVQDIVARWSTGKPGSYRPSRDIFATV